MSNTLFSVESQDFRYSQLGLFLKHFAIIWYNFLSAKSPWANIKISFWRHDDVITALLQPLNHANVIY